MHPKSPRLPPNLRARLGRPPGLMATSRTARRIASLVIAVGLLSACMTVSAPPANAALRMHIGVASVSTHYQGADFAGEVAQIRETGATVIRVAAKWNLIQPYSSSAFNWGTLDAAVAAAKAGGLTVLMNLEGPAPVWAQKPGAIATANGNAPRDPAAFGEFARQVAIKYSSRVAAWEIWNEPNLAHYLLPPTASEYVPLLKAAHSALRSVGSFQPVVTGGLSSSRDETRDVTFISDMYALGARNYFDGIGVHPYTFPYPISADPRGGDGGGAAVLPAARATMIANGDSGKSVWVTEFGQPTGSTGASTSEQVQSDIIADAITRANSLPWIAAFIIFNTHDLSTDRTNENANFGLYRYDGSPKPVVPALQRLLRTSQ